MAGAVARRQHCEGKTHQGTALYLCLEDSTLRIQNRLFDITEDAPASVHFCTEAAIIGEGLENQIEKFIGEHTDTTFIIIDTLQMVRRAVGDNSYANDYRELAALKKLVDRYEIAIMLIHHLRKQSDKDPFNRISGTTGLSGAVDGSFVLAEEKRGSREAVLCCIGRDIEYREIGLERDENNVWNKISDSLEAPESSEDRAIALLSDLVLTGTDFIGTPTELVERIDPDGSRYISIKKISRQILQNADKLRNQGVLSAIRRSNGRRLIELRSADRADNVKTVGGGQQIVPVGTCGSLEKPVDLS